MQPSDLIILPSHLSTIIYPVEFAYSLLWAISPSPFHLFSWLVLAPVFASLDAVCSLAHLSSIQFKLTFHKSLDTRYNRCIRNMQAELKKWFLIITTPIISALLINIKWSMILPACRVWHKNSGSLGKTDPEEGDDIIWSGLVLSCVCIVSRRLGD